MVLKIGHMGAAGYFPGNSLESFQKSLDLKVDLIELDVRKCKSGELILAHDHLISLNKRKHIIIEELTLNELNKLLKKKGEQVTLLTQALDLINRKTKVNIDIKSSKIVNRLIKIIRNHVEKKGWQYEDFIVSSFNHYDILELKQKEPKILRGILTSNLSIDYTKKFKKLKPFVISSWFEAINKKLILDAKKNKIKVFAWTVDDKTTIEKMKKLKVDGIISNYPDRI